MIQDWLFKTGAVLSSPCGCSLSSTGVYVDLRPLSLSHFLTERPWFIRTGQAAYAWLNRVLQAERVWFHRAAFP